jgi:hypothetical protein
MLTKLFARLSVFFCHPFFYVMLWVFSLIACLNLLSKTSGTFNCIGVLIISLAWQVYFGIEVEEKWRFYFAKLKLLKFHQGWLLVIRHDENSRLILWPLAVCPEELKHLNRIVLGGWDVESVGVNGIIFSRPESRLKQLLRYPGNEVELEGNSVIWLAGQKKDVPLVFSFLPLGSPESFGIQQVIRHWIPQPSARASSPLILE